jgi:hypothetical protein
MWRISNDHWDRWSFAPNDQEFPFGLHEEFDRLAQWAPYVKPGNWPDPDMLALGSLAPHPEIGKPRESGLTADEQRTEFTLWVVARAPLILGANLTKLDDSTLMLITDRDVLNINQEAVSTHVGALQGRSEIRFWLSSTVGFSAKQFLAVFNLGDRAAVVDSPWTEFQLRRQPHAVYDMWNKKELPNTASLRFELPAHGCALFQMR